MLDQKQIANIRETGIVQGTVEAEKRAKLLQQELGFRMVDKAEYALIASCLNPFHLTEAMRAFSNLLRHFEVDYTLLRREYCCGGPHFLQALRDKSEEELNQSQLLAREYLENNLRQVREGGASKIITFCQGCDVVYRRLKDTIPQEVLWYPALLAHFFRGGELELEADYYAGCYYLDRRLSPTPVDLDSPLKVLSQIKGLKLNQLNDRLCCARPKQIEPLADSVQNQTVITICGGCTTRLQEALKGRGNYRVVMLPQVAWAAVSGGSL